MVTYASSFCTCISRIASHASVHVSARVRPPYSPACRPTWAVAIPGCTSGCLARRWSAVSITISL